MTTLLDMGYHVRDSIPPSESSHTRGSQRRKTFFMSSRSTFTNNWLLPAECACES